MTLSLQLNSSFAVQSTLVAPVDGRIVHDCVDTVQQLLNLARRYPIEVLSTKPVRDNYNLKSHKYVCITTYQPDTKSNPNPNPNPSTANNTQ